MWAVIRGLFLAACLIASGAGQAQDWHEPARGTAERARLMNAIRPLAEWQLGAPVEFVVHTLRVTSDHAFALVDPQRPGGAPIDIDVTPLVREFGEDAWYYREIGGLGIVALLIREGDQWAVVDHSIGATDAWFTAPVYCREFAELIGEYCPQ